MNHSVIFLAEFIQSLIRPDPEIARAVQAKRPHIIMTQAEGIMRIMFEMLEFRQKVQTLV